MDTADGLKMVRIKKYSLLLVAAVVLPSLSMVVGFVRPTGSGVSLAARHPATYLSKSHDLNKMGVISAQEALISPSKARLFRKNRSQGRLGTAEPATRQKRPIKNKIVREKGERPLYVPYSVTIEALRTYHAQHGDLDMPRRFIVPSDDDTYPEAWHGLDLSSGVYNMKWWQDHVKQRSERVVELSKLGFRWQRLQPEWNLILEALITYQTIYGDTLVPHKFVVPRSKDWPAATWGIPLGTRCARIRSRNDFLRDPHSAASRRDQLDGLGFVWEGTQEWRFRKFYVALRIFAHVEGTGKLKLDRVHPLIVPSDFVVPETSDIWPEELWGYPLGAKCVAVRQKGVYVKGKPERRALLDELGFHWAGNADLGWLKVVHAAAIYSKLNNRQLDVPFKFRVPSRPHDDGADWPWPRYLWGLPLGQRLRDVRTKNAYLRGETGKKRRQQLDALGFNWEPSRGRPPNLKEFDKEQPKDEHDRLDTRHSPKS